MAQKLSVTYGIGDGVEVTVTSEQVEIKRFARHQMDQDEKIHLTHEHFRQIKEIDV